VKKTTVIFLIMILMLSFPTVASQPSQNVFRVVFYIHIHSNGDASVQMVVTPLGEELLKELNELAKKNETSANRKFSLMLYDLYSQLLRDAKEKYGKVNFTYNFITIPSHWTGVVNFVWRHFLVQKNGTWETPVYGPITYVYEGIVYSYSWYRMYLWLPSGAYFLNSIPKPADFEEGVLMWKNGDFIPYLSMTYNSTLYAKLTGKKVLTLSDFLARTKKYVFVKFIPQTGTLNLTLNLTGLKPTSQVEWEFSRLLNSTFQIVSYNLRVEKNGLVISLIVKPNISERSSLLGRTWTVDLKLPFKPDYVVLRGEGRLVQTNENIKVILEKRSYSFLLAFLFIPIFLFLLWRWKNGS